MNHLHLTVRMAQHLKILLIKMKKKSSLLFLENKMNFIQYFSMKLYQGANANLNEYI